jgi:PIN domain nuclease of toxin-antitoxin system
VKLLLDTHAFIWFAGDTSKLSPIALNALKDPTNERFLSDASVWEMAIKIQLGKLQFPAPFDQKVFEALKRSQVAILPIRTHHVAAVSDLPLHHRDPFDRLLAIQANMENLTLVTHDPLFAPYGVAILW